MDKGGESLSPAEIPYAPATPAKSGRSDPDVICENKKSFSYWEGNLGSTSQLFEMNGGLTYNGFCMDNVETWHSISCRDLLALADATIVTTGLNAPQYDLNKPPQTITESHLSTGLSLSSHFTPLTPDHAKRAEFRHMASDIAISNEEHPLADISTLGEANQEKGLTEETNVNVNETPQPKQRRRKHRPKVVIEGQPKRSRKSTTPKKPDGSSITPNPNVSSTGKRKYVRKKVVEKPTPTPVMEETSGTIDPSPDQQNKNSCKRKIHFDEPEKVTEVVVEKIQVELTLDKSKTCKSPNPITPSKTELPHEKRTYTKAKCRINFLQETHDKAPSGIPSPNESNCSTSINISTGVSTDIGTGTSTIISNDTGGCFKGEEATGSKKIRVCCESLEAYLSAYTDYNSGMHIPDIFKKNKIGKCESAERSACKALEMSTLHGVKENPIKKRTKALTEVCDSASYQRHMYMEAHAADFQVSVATKKRVKKNATMPALYHNHHMGCHPNLRLKNIYYDIHGLIKDFERLNMENQMTEQHMGALIPYLSGYNDNNALVVYQQDGTLVPFEGLFNPVKKRKPRPKVDLDDETSRVWRLLLEDINSQGIDGTDEDKAKWWEEERRVFCGRADSFIARMHLVQGDRRFSRWKGSVLDSVIGVFLTQNVSDHLSSSAFMSLAARYPVKSKSTSEPLQEEQPILYVKEPCQEDQNETIKWHEENSNHPMEDHGSMMLQDAESSKEKVANSSEFYINSTSSECVVLEKSKKDLEVDDIVSSPSSVQSSVAHTVEEQKDGSKATVLDGYTSFVELLHMQKGPTTVRGSYSQEQADESSNKKITHDEEKCASEESGLSAESAVQMVKNLKVNTGQHTDDSNCEATESNNIVETLRETVHKVVEFNVNDCGSNQVVNGMDEGSSKVKRVKTVKVKKIEVEWDNLRLQAEVKEKKERSPDTMDSLDYDAVMKADVNDIADAIKERGMNNVLAGRIKDLLDRLVKDHGSIDLEWLRDVPPDKAKEYLLSFRGLGLKSVECVRLLTLHHLAFPVDTNVGRIAVRLGWVPLQPLPESLQLHLLELYPVLESIQKYLWPRLCKLDQRTLYELHYQMITFGKVFCTKSKPNCNACPMRGECRHFASAFASARLGLPAPDEKSTVTAIENTTGQSQTPIPIANQQHLTLPPANEQLPHGPQQLEVQICNPVIEEPASPEPIVEVPETPEPEQIQQEFDIEDFCEDPEEIPMIKLNIEEFTQNLQTYMERHMELGEGDMSRALVALTSEAAAIPTPKLKNVSQLRTEHQVYELPDSHPLLEGLDTREPDDPCSYLLAIWTPGETADSIQPPVGQCSSQESGTLCNEETCFFCNSTREANSQTVRGTLLIPCRTAMRGSFPLNGTYFQVNEVFADHESSLNPIDVPRSWLWNLPRRIVYFGTSIPTIFKGLTTEDIQYCFWRGFVCVRGFDQKTRAPRPLMARLHFPASRLKRSRGKTDEIKH